MTILMSPVTRCFFWMETSPNRRVDNHKAQKIHTHKKKKTHKMHKALPQPL